MAKPIEATPTLSGRNAEKFCNDLINPTYTEKEKNLFADLKKLEELLNKNK